MCDVVRVVASVRRKQQLKERDRLREAKKAICKAQHEAMRKMWMKNEDLVSYAHGMKIEGLYDGVASPGR